MNVLKLRLKTITTMKSTETWSEGNISGDPSFAYPI